MREMLHGHGLKPHPPWTSECGEKDAVTAEERVLDSRDGGDVELHRLLVHADMAGVNPQGVAGLEVIGDDLTAELNPSLALSGQTLHAEAGPAEHPRAESLLEAHRELHAGGGAHESVAMHQVTGRGRDFHGQDLAGQLRRERE